MVHLGSPAGAGSTEWTEGRVGWDVITGLVVTEVVGVLLFNIEATACMNKTNKHKPR